MSKRRCGWSMIELTIVILIVGITAAFAAPRLGDAVAAIKLRAATNQLAAHVDYIRRVAVNEARATTLVCDNTLHSYRSNEVDFPERRGELLHVLIREVHHPDFVLTADFDNMTTLAFDFEGTPMVAGAPLVSGKITIALGNEKHQVQIAAGTGETTVSRVIPPDNEEPPLEEPPQEEPPPYYMGF